MSALYPVAGFASTTAHKIRETTPPSLAVNPSWKVVHCASIQDHL